MTHPALEQKFLVDSYQLWAKKEHVPLHHSERLSLKKLSTSPWPRFGMAGAICDVTGRCDFLSLFLFCLDPFKTSNPMRHIYDANYYVLEGSGETHITLYSGQEEIIRWSEGHAFTIPANADYHLASTTHSSVRLICVSDMRYLMGLYRNEDFIFANPAPLSARQNQAVSRGLLHYLLTSDSDIHLGDSAIAFERITIPARSRTTAHRQMQGQHILALSGHPLIISFYEGATDYKQTHLDPYDLTGLKGMMFHQIANPSDQEINVLAMSLGSQSAPIFRARRYAYGDHSVYASGEAILNDIYEPASLKNLWHSILAP